MPPLSILLGPFELLEPIARGGMGEVYRGVHVGQQVPVAVKVLTSRSAGDSDVQAAFRNEVRAVARLYHRNIIMLFDQGVVSDEVAQASLARFEPGSPYLAMELVSGGTLEGLRDCPAWPRLRELVLDILDALAHAHARGVIHRDLKPANVLLPGASDVRPGIKLTDFGIARAMVRGGEAHPDDSDGVISGTLRYMAPEQVAGQWRDEGPWTDLYALGIMTFRLATGRLPFGEARGEQLMRCHLHVPPPVLDESDAFPPGFPAWVDRLLAKRPANRFERAADAAYALRSLSALTTDCASRPGRRNPRAGTIPEGETEESAPPRLLVERDRVTLPRFSAAPWGEDDDSTTPLPALTGPTSESRRRLRDWEANEVLSEPASVPPVPRTWRRPTLVAPSMRLVGAGLGLYGVRPIPMLDRERERDLLWKRLREASKAQFTRVLALHGASGCGKSRLVEWITQRAHEVGAAWVLRATHSPIAGPADGMPHMIADHLNAIGLDRDGLLLRCSRFVAERALATDTKGEAASLAELVSPEPEPEDQGERGRPRVRLATPEDRYRVARRFVERLCGPRPVVLWFDDVQWGSDAIAFADFLLRSDALSPLPILILMTYREESLAERPVERIQLDLLFEEPAAERLEIGALAPTDHRELVERLLGLSGDLAAQVVSRTDGNPLFAVQLVGDWVQRRLLNIGRDGFELGPGASAELPDDMHQVWCERVTRIALQCEDVPADRAIAALEIAAALGQVVVAQEWHLACALAGLAVPANLLEGLLSDHLATAQENGWSFCHGMLCESLERRAREAGRWSRHHRACAEMLDRQYRADEVGVADRRGRHLMAAGDLEEALEPLLRGAEQRRLTSDFHLAHALYEERELALARLDVPRDDPRWSDGRVRRARAYATQGRMDEAAALVTRVEGRCAARDWPGIAAWAHVVRGYMALGQGETGKAFTAFESGVELFHQTDDPRGLADCLTGFGAVCMWRRDLREAIRHYKKAYALHERTGDLYELGAILRGMANVRHCAGDLDGAAELLERARSCFEHNGNRYNVATCMNDLGEISRSRGDMDRAAKLYRKAARLFDSLGCDDASTPRFNVGLVLLARGDQEKARTVFEAELDRLQTSKRTIDLLWLHVGLLPCVAAARDWEAWDFHFDRVDALLEDFVDEDIAWCARQGGDLAARANDLERARRAFGLARQQWQRIGDDQEVARIETDLAAL